MKTIFYGLPGEGLGHACRTQALLEHLDDYEVHIFTWGEAYEFFKKLNYPKLHEIVGIPFGRNNDNSIDTWKTICNFGHYITNAKKNIKYVLEMAKNYKPSLFISDFEGIVPRAGKYYGKPVISIDNQHKFSRTDSKGLPFNLKLYAYLMGLYAEWTCPKPDFAIVSTFYHSAVRKKHLGKTAMVNCFMRKNIEEKQPYCGDYILVYYKTSVGHKILNELAKTKERVIVYNCPAERRSIDKFEYREVSNEGFTEALSGCKALFCAAGNQLLGEAVYCGKKIYAIPEPNQPEQTINAFYLERMGHGMSRSVERFDYKDMKVFLDSFQPVVKERTNGAYDAIEQIRRHAK